LHINSLSLQSRRIRQRSASACPKAGKPPPNSDCCAVRAIVPGSEPNSAAIQGFQFRNLFRSAVAGQAQCNDPSTKQSQGRRLGDDAWPATTDGTTRPTRQAGNLFVLRNKQRAVIQVG